MVKATGDFIFLVDALKKRISDVGGNSDLAQERIIADLDAYRLEVTWEDRDGATYTDLLPDGCATWADAQFDWSKSTARWGPNDDIAWAFCIKVRAAKELPTTVAAETRCGEWLKKEMRASPTKSPKSKLEFHIEAKSLFGVSGRAFNRAWTSEIKSTGAAWQRPGRRKKS
jgi:hypothetical protein